MATNLLKDTQLKALGIRFKADGVTPISEYLLSDGAGDGGYGALYLVVRFDSKSGIAKRWAYLYTSPVTHKRVRHWLGVYPALRLAEAREKAAACRALVKDDKDPQIERAQAKAQVKREAQRVEATFGALAEQWLTDASPHWGVKRKQYVESLLANYILPTLRKRPISEIKGTEVAHVVGIPRKKGCKDVPRRVRAAVREVWDCPVSPDRLVNLNKPPRTALG